MSKWERERDSKISSEASWLEEVRQRDYEKEIEKLLDHKLERGAKMWDDVLHVQVDSLGKELERKIGAICRDIEQMERKAADVTLTTNSNSSNSGADSKQQVY